jgi:uncharacterized membrane protein
MPVELLALRAIHILAGTFWVGAGVFSSAFLVPALGRTGPATTASVMEALQRRQLFTAMPVAALLTIGSGVRMFWLVSGGSMEHYFHTRMGHAFAVSGVMAIIAFCLAMFISRPAMVRAGALAAQLAAASPEDRGAGERRVQALRARSSTVSMIAVILLVLGAAGMSVARYL